MDHHASSQGARAQTIPTPAAQVSIRDQRLETSVLPAHYCRDCQERLMTFLFIYFSIIEQDQAFFGIVDEVNEWFVRPGRKITKILRGLNKLLKGQDLRELFDDWVEGNLQFKPGRFLAGMMLNSTDLAFQAFEGSDFAVIRAAGKVQQILSQKIGLSAFKLEDCIRSEVLFQRKEKRAHRVRYARPDRPPL